MDRDHRGAPLLCGCGSLLARLVVWLRSGCFPPGLVWAVLTEGPPRCSRGGLLLRAFGEAVAAEVTPYSLHAGSVRSCIFRIPTVHTPEASLHSLHSPIAIVTMSRSMPNITTVKMVFSPAQRAWYCEHTVS